jgi:outer membrane protein
MKRILMICSAAMLVLMTSSTFAQTGLKFAHINLKELISVMPGRDSAEIKLNAYAQDLSDQIEELHVEYNNKLQTFVQRKDSFTPAIRESREKELGSLQQRIQEFEQTAQQDFQRMQGELMKPIVDKANETISKVAKREGYLYVFDVSSQVLLYYSEQSVDILPVVKKELGIKTEKK